MGEVSGPEMQDLLGVMAATIHVLSGAGGFHLPRHNVLFI